MADDAVYLSVAQSVDKHDHVSYEVRHGEGGQVHCLETACVPSRGPSISSLVHGYGVVACFCQQR